MSEAKIGLAWQQLALDLGAMPVPHCLGYLGRSSVSVGLWRQVACTALNREVMYVRGREGEEKAIMGGLNWYSS